MKRQYEGEGDFEDECSFDFSSLQKENRTEKKYDPKKDKNYLVVYPGLSIKAFCDNN
jgi:hypothetical protein